LAASTIHLGGCWRAFVQVVLALSGVEAIANLTGVMKKPVFATARKSIWTVAAEVALFNLILAVAMVAHPPGREAHTEDMLAYQAGFLRRAVGEFLVRGVGGLLLLSAANTAVNGLMSITYVMSRDGELPGIFQKLNGFGAPWIGANHRHSHPGDRSIALPRHPDAGFALCHWRGWARWRLTAAYARCIRACGKPGAGR